MYETSKKTSGLSCVSPQMWARGNELLIPVFASSVVLLAIVLAIAALEVLEVDAICIALPAAIAEGIAILYFISRDSKTGGAGT